MNRGPLLLLLALPACFTSLVDPAQIDCKTSGHCPSGYHCEASTQKCLEGVEDESCALDLDCPFTEICRGNSCVAGCRENGDCGLNRACIAGACADRPGACNDDWVCKFGERCDLTRQSCVRHDDAQILCKSCGSPRWCLDDGECAPGDRCERPHPNSYGTCNSCGAGECAYQGSGTSCAVDDQCGGGERCLRRVCLDDSSCAGFGSCTGPANTEGGGRASENLRSCSMGVCAQATCRSVGCSDDSCPRGYACFSLIELPNTPACTSDQECGGGRQCRRLNEADETRFCSCLDDADCPEGTTCTNGGCVDHRACMPALGLSCEEVRP